MMHQIVHFTRSILSVFKIWRRLLVTLTIVAILFWVVCSETALADSVIRSRESEASTLIPNSEFRIP
ncbi:insulinase family protein, partial [Chroococcidiopsidales cyanobacterium LEGE 13417]|nr:insulinase family protein [Chroococcidiopsidales cyanobacterium LEGE 13417]